MRYLLLIIIFFNSNISAAQDSLQKKKLSLYDCALFMAFDFIENERKINPEYIQSFTRDPRHQFNNSEFPDTADYALYDNPGGETDGGEFGFVTTFKFNNAGKIISRLKPRAGAFYNYKQFFSYDLELSKTTALSAPSADKHFDSVALRKITYSYYSEQICYQLGFNYDLLRRKSVVLYTGLLFSQGISFKNEFSTQAEDSYRIDSRDNNEPAVTGLIHNIKTRSYSSNEPLSTSVRLALPFGLQQRFSNLKKFSMGLMLEGTIGYERYVIERGRSVTFGFFAVSAGLRFSLDKHL